MSKTINKNKLQTKGITMGWMPARLYDGIVGLCTLGREDTYRRELVDLAGIQPGDRVLDVGCGTGSCAILAAQDAGANGQVIGLDATPSLLRRARHKAALARKEQPALQLEFVEGLAEAIPADDASFQVVLCTFTFHHLPSEELQQKALVEMKRVLVPGGTLVIVDLPWGQEHHGCCGHEAETDPTAKSVQQAGFVDVTARTVRMMNAVATMGKKSQ